MVNSANKGKIDDWSSQWRQDQHDLANEGKIDKIRTRSDEWKQDYSPPAIIHQKQDRWGSTY